MPIGRLVAIGCLFIGALEGRAAELKRFEYTEPHMGTVYRLVLYAADRPTADVAAKSAFGRIEELEAIMSDYRPESELMRLCQHAGGPPVHVSNELYTVLRQARRVSEESAGAFDVTIGPLSHLWRRARRTGSAPDSEQIRQAKDLVDFGQMRLDDVNHTVQLTKAGMLLDLGGIGKGFSADEAIASLRAHGITRALVAAGGDIAVSDPPPDAPGWRIAIATPGTTAPSIKRYIRLASAAVSTSGDAEQHLEAGGKRYSHIIDPRTGMGIVGRQTATVIAPKGILADSLTKVASILEPAKALPIVERLGGKVLIVRLENQGEHTIMSNGFLVEETASRD
jgi:thiamine biosynthesis lipoprotein